MTQTIQHAIAAARKAMKLGSSTWCAYEIGKAVLRAAGLDYNEYADAIEELSNAIGV